MTSAVASAVRPGLRDNRTTSSPHTPTRFTSVGSNFSSPGSTFRQEEDAIIVELGARYLRAGFGGESGPHCVVSFDKESSRRVGDYRAYVPGYRRKSETFEDWAKENELWRSDLRDVDLGLVEDKLQRAITEVYNKYLLVDAGNARLVLVLSSIVAHPLLERVLTLLFDRWNCSTITLLPSPTMCVVSAGLRSGLVVDIGWEETVVTSVFEYRELQERRSARAMKMLVRKSAEALAIFASSKLGVGKAAEMDPVFAEELVMRLAHCKMQTKTTTTVEQLSVQTESLSVSEEGEFKQDPHEADVMIEMDWPVGTSSQRVKLPLSSMSECVESTFCNPGIESKPLDDHEQTLPELIYQTLLSLPPDVRGICMSRVIFVGGGSQIPGLSAKTLRDVQALIDLHGWTPVRGEKVKAQRKKLAEFLQGRAELPEACHNVLAPPEEKDYVEQILRKEQAKRARPPDIGGVLRQLESLGAWAGASLVTSLKVKGFVEVDKERFLSHGLSGANKDFEISLVPQRMSSFGLSGIKSNDKAGFTLGQWA